MTAGAILDVDGTLVDTNYQHALAWHLAFRQHDMCPPVAHIHRHIGMGGDQLVRAVAGDEAERRCGDEIRAAHDALYLASIDTVTVFEGARDLLGELHERGQRLVLASSASQQEIEHYLGLLGARDVVDAWTSADDVDRTKPHPELVEVALHLLGTTDAVMVGDTRWDVLAAARAGVPAIAVLTGGIGHVELTEAGAIRVYESVAELRAQLDSSPIVA